MSSNLLQHYLVLLSIVSYNYVIFKREICWVLVADFSIETMQTTQEVQNGVPVSQKRLMSSKNVSKNKQKTLR